MFLKLVHPKNNTYKDNYISVHTSWWYCPFILSAYSSAAWKSRACYSRTDYDWLSIFIIHQLEKNRFESDSNDIVSLCLYRYSCGVDSAIL